MLVGIFLIIINVSFNGITCVSGFTATVSNIHTRKKQQNSILYLSTTTTTTTTTTTMIDEMDQKVDRERSSHIDWNADRYQILHSFVWKFGLNAILDLSKPVLGEKVLDLGCGTGELTNEIAKFVHNDDNTKNETLSSSSNVVGIDSDQNMITTAQKQYENIQFLQMDMRNFHFDDKFDLIISNAALHWVPPGDDINNAIQCISDSLKEGGRFVAEFGGKGNIQQIVQACTDVYDEMDSLDVPYKYHSSPWYFPSIAELSLLLESKGIEVIFVDLYDRPTPLEDGPNGIRNWLQMFGQQKLLPDNVGKEELETFITRVEQTLKPKLYRMDEEKWYADYRRIRVVGIKK